MRLEVTAMAIRRTAVTARASYDEAIQANSDAGKHYDWAQLCAEIGIVIASIALLLSNRAAWLASAAFGVACAGLIAWTFVSTSGHLGHAEEEIARTKATYEQLRKTDGGDGDDEKLLAEIESELKDLEQARAAAGRAAVAAPEGTH